VHEVGLEQTIRAPDLLPDGRELIMLKDCSWHKTDMPVDSPHVRS
jgi:hypothetical protein